MSSDVKFVVLGTIATIIGMVILRCVMNAPTTTSTKKNGKGNGGGNAVLG